VCERAVACPAGRSSFVGTVRWIQSSSGEGLAILRLVEQPKDSVDRIDECLEGVFHVMGIPARRVRAGARTLFTLSVGEGPSARVFKSMRVVSGWRARFSFRARFQASCCAPQRERGLWHLSRGKDSPQTLQCPEGGVLVAIHGAHGTTATAFLLSLPKPSWTSSETAAADNKGADGSLQPPTALMTADEDRA
jgi:hypothetical protein